MLKALRKWEPLLLFLTIFSPGYISQGVGVSSLPFDSPQFNLSYLFFASPQLWLIIYLIFQDSRISHRRYGLCVFRATIPLKALGGVGVILLALLPFYLIIGLLVFTGVIPPWDAADLKFSNYPILPLVFLTCICTGYLEESFFRAYLLTKGEGWGIGRTTLIVLSNTLFALGHLYQGMAGFFLTFLIGLALSWLFLRTRNLHFIAWSHGYYNFLVLLLNSLGASVGGDLYAPIP